MNLDNFDLKETLAKRRWVGLYRLMNGYHAIYLFAILFVGVSAIARTGIYYLLGFFVDTALISDNMRQLLPLIALGFVGLAVVQGIATFLGGRLAAKTSEGIARRVRNYLYDHMQRLTFSYHDRMQSGELLQRSTSDVDTIRRLFAEQLIGIGRIALVFIVSLTGLILISPRLALISIAVIPVVLIISVYFFIEVGRRYEAYQEQDAVVTNRLQESLSGVRVVRAFARQSYETDRFEQASVEMRKRGFGLTWINAVFWPSTDIMCGLQMLLAYYIGGRMAITGTISIGDYVASVGLLAQVIWPIRNLGRLIADISTGLVSFGRISEIITVEREPLTEGSVRPETRPQGVLRFENVSFRYEGEEADVLHDITFEVQPGQTIALLGSTGSGKSSLVSLLPRFYEYTGGRITLDGIELKQLPRDYLRRHIGIVMQEPFLFAASVRENVAYGVNDGDYDDAALYAAAEAAAVHDVIQNFPDGYNTLVGERGVTLSGGQKQRVTLARTFLQNPSILIMDDATSAVDTETESRIRDALQHLMQNRTTFIIAHRIQTVMYADQILVMDQGRIVQSGTHDELLAQGGGLYRRIYDLQASIETELQAELHETAIHANGKPTVYEALPLV